MTKIINGSQTEGLNLAIKPLKYRLLKSNVATAHPTAAELRGIVIKINKNTNCYQENPC